MSPRSAVTALLAFAASSTVALAQPYDIPPELNPDHLTVYLEASATGAQIYICGKNAAGAWVWNFKAPEAALFDIHQAALGKHFAGPTWEGLDGGKVVGGVKASMASPMPGAIPWLRLDIKSHVGTGAFTEAKGIIRLGTSGGAAPAQGCDEAHSGAEVHAPYTATYLFLK